MTRNPRFYQKHRTYLGTIICKDRHFFVVSAPEAPTHLQTMYLIKSLVEIPDPKVGDSGTLVYRVTSGSGLWYLTKT